MKKFFRILTSLMLLSVPIANFSSCAKADFDWKPNKIKTDVHSDTLEIEAIENIPEEFIFGMDASCVPSLEAGGVKYYDHDGVEKDVYKILAENGVNYMRVRIWNDPFDKDGNGYGGGNCDIENAVKVGKRATENDLKLLVNFHYSDFWADPAKQKAPKAWAALNIDEKCDALYTYTKECLNRLVSEGIEIGMVQVGNETNGAMCGEYSDDVGGWERICKMMSAGSRAVREVCPGALVVIHFSNPEKVTNYDEYSSNLAKYEVDYDVFASSYYPFWHGTLENLTAVLNKVVSNYGKKIMIAETSYAYTPDDTDFNANTVGGDSDLDGGYPFSVEGQVDAFCDLVKTTVDFGGLGVFYWEGTWISSGGKTYEENKVLWEKYGSGWATSYAGEYDPEDAGKWYGGCAVDNQALFDVNGKALESLKMFGLLKKE